MSPPILTELTLRDELAMAILVEMIGTTQHESNDCAVFEFSPAYREARAREALAFADAFMKVRGEC